MPVSRFIRTVKRGMREQLLRRTHPVLYDDRAQELKIRRLAERLSGKTFAIVGNARSLFDVERGPEIDGADVVVRINRGFITRPYRKGRAPTSSVLRPQSSRMNSRRNSVMFRSSICRRGGGTCRRECCARRTVSPATRQAAGQASLP